MSTNTSEKYKSHLRWFRLSGMVDNRGLIELTAACSDDGIEVIARWTLEPDGSWSVMAMDTEAMEWSEVTTWDPDGGDYIPLTPPECVDVELEQERDAAREELGIVKRDKVRLDYLDYLNRGLNARSGTMYGWVLTLSENVRRLSVNFPHGIDLNDAQAVGCHPTGRLSVRSAIDARISDAGGVKDEADQQARKAVDLMLAREMLDHAKKFEWSGDFMRCRECLQSVHYIDRHGPLQHAEGCKTYMAYPWDNLQAVASNI